MVEIERDRAAAEAEEGVPGSAASLPDSDPVRVQPPPPATRHPAGMDDSTIPATADAAPGKRLDPADRLGEGEWPRLDAQWVAPPILPFAPSPAGRLSCAYAVYASHSMHGIYARHWRNVPF